MPAIKKLTKGNDFMKHRQKNESGLAHIGIIIAAILVVAALAFGGWYVWDKNKEDKTSTDSTSQNKNQEEVSEIPEGFQLYENKEFGFSFAYPKEVGSLTQGDAGNNSDILLYVKSKDAKDAFAPHTQSPLYVRVDKTDDFLTRGNKYGPVLEFDNGKWIVSSKEGGDVLDGGYTIGSEYKPPIARTVNGIQVYDFSFTDEGCRTTVWIFKLEASFTTITLPAVCADETDTIPQERLTDYKEVSDQVLGTLTIN